MASKKHNQKKCLYKSPRYWYHISTTLENKLEYLTPRDNRKSLNRNMMEPNNERICVAPTIAQCLAAVPYAPGDVLTVYRTVHKCIASQPCGIYDAHLTDEGWIQIPTMFERIGFLSLPELARKKDINIREEAASSNCLQQCGKVLKWWQKIKPQLHLKQT